jgi:hypothetical protein
LKNNSVPLWHFKYALLFRFAKGVNLKIGRNKILWGERVFEEKIFDCSLQKHAHPDKNFKKLWTAKVELETV